MSKRPELPKGEMVFPGLKYNGTCWEEDDNTPWVITDEHDILTQDQIDAIFNQPGEIDLEMIHSEPPVEKKLTCECGAASINSIGHAHWCPLGGDDV